MSIAVAPVVLVASLVLCDGLYSLFGYEAGNITAPSWVQLTCGLPPVAAFLAPCATAALYGDRARVAGRGGGVVPFVIGVMLGVLWLTASLSSLLSGLFL